MFGDTENIYYLLLLAKKFYHSVRTALRPISNTAGAGQSSLVISLHKLDWIGPDVCTQDVNYYTL